MFGKPVIPPYLSVRISKFYIMAHTTVASRTLTNRFTIILYQLSDGELVTIK